MNDNLHRQRQVLLDTLCDLDDAMDVRTRRLIVYLADLALSDQGLTLNEQAEVACIAARAALWIEDLSLSVVATAVVDPVLFRSVESPDRVSSTLVAELNHLRRRLPTLARRHGAQRSPS